MKDMIGELYELCIAQPFEVERIQNYITKYNIDGASITRMAIKLCEYAEFEYADYVYRYNELPKPENMKSYNWDKLFAVLVENGLDANLVFKSDNSTENNILRSLMYLDNKDIGPRIIKKILEKGGTPNIVIEGMPFFTEVDDNFVFDIECQLYEDKWREEIAFQFWLVLVGFGGIVSNEKCPVEMREGYIIEELREFYKYTYKVHKDDKDICISIILKDNGEEVAVVSRNKYIYE